MSNVGTTKNEEGRVLHLIGELLDLIQRQKTLRDTWHPECPWVFHRNGQPIKYFRKAWRTACRKAGVPDRLFHDARRSAVRNLVRSGVPERVAMGITGHKTRDVFERYNIVSGGDLLDGAVKLDQYLQRWTETATVKES